MLKHLARVVCEALHACPNTAGMLLTMQLTHFSDLGLRVLMYLTQPERSTPVTITEIATQFNVSRHHLVKVVHFMAQQGWVITTRGKGGGLALAKLPQQYSLGDLIRGLEGTQELIDCADPPCALRSACRLKNVFDKALDAFYQTLDQYTLADSVASPTGEAIIRLVRSR